MQISEILGTERVQAGFAASSKKRALEQAARLVSRALGNSEGGDAAIFDALLARERLGSTALGDGVAVPHCRLAACRQSTGVLLQLTEGIDFDAPDNQPVDLLFVLVVPAEATDMHLQLLGRVAAMFSDADMRTRLRSARGGAELLQCVQTFERDAGGA